MHSNIFLFSPGTWGETIPFDYQPPTGSGQRSIEALAFGDAWQSEVTAPGTLRPAMERWKWFYFTNQVEVDDRNDEFG